MTKAEVNKYLFFAMTVLSLTGWAMYDITMHTISMSRDHAWFWQDGVKAITAPTIWYFIQGMGKSALAIFIQHRYLGDVKRRLEEEGVTQ